MKFRPKEADKAHKKGIDEFCVFLGRRRAWLRIAGMILGVDIL